MGEPLLIGVRNGRKVVKGASAERKRKHACLVCKVGVVEGGS